MSLQAPKMSISTIRRQVKNVAYNFSDAQIKVRKATSNDPWGPSTALMSEIADLTNKPMAFTEIMSIVWKRLNDSGKNWRHVFKSLVLLDFLLKCGNEKVVQQCRENIYAIDTLKGFQHVEDNCDKGLDVRNMAELVTHLLSNEDKLKKERTRYTLKRNKFNANRPASDVTESTARRSRQQPDYTLEYEEARPSSDTEEDIQLQIALALSREDHEKMDELRKSDDVRLQLAMEESKKQAQTLTNSKQDTVNSGQLTQRALDDLLSLDVGEMVSTGFGHKQKPYSSWVDAPQLVDPWFVPQSLLNTPQYSAPLYPGNQRNDPWASISQAAPVGTVPTADRLATWDVTPYDNLNNCCAMPGDLLAPMALTKMNNAASNNGTSMRKSPANFLGEHSNLVNLDNLLGTSSTTMKGGNSYFSSGPPAATNQLAVQQHKPPTLNELRAAQDQASSIPAMAARGALP